MDLVHDVGNLHVPKHLDPRLTGNMLMCNKHRAQLHELVGNTLDSRLTMYFPFLAIAPHAALLKLWLATRNHARRLPWCLQRQGAVAGAMT